MQNLKVLARLRQLGVAEEKVTEWAAWVNREGLSACEALIKGEQGPFCFGDDADALRTFAWCRSLRMRGASASTSRPIRACSKAEAAAKEMKAFADAAPDKQADAE